MNAPLALTVFEIPDTERPGAVLSLAVCAYAYGTCIRISNTTEQPVRILLGGHEQVLSRRPIAPSASWPACSSFVRPWISRITISGRSARPA